MSDVRQHSLRVQKILDDRHPELTFEKEASDPRDCGAMDPALFERLLYEEEGNALDFKRDQYLFFKATNDEKAELLKDFLGLANSFRRADAYILIGVEEVRRGRSNVVGITEHLADHSLQWSRPGSGFITSTRRRGSPFPITRRGRI
jgi:hypothetical protein